MDEGERLRPASDDEVKESISFGLRYRGRRRVTSADDVMAQITAERLIEHLRQSGFVVMKRPDAVAPSSEVHRKKPDGS